jgi:hypothetical protein
VFNESMAVVFDNVISGFWSEEVFNESMAVVFDYVISGFCVLYKNKTHFISCALIIITGTFWLLASISKVTLLATASTARFNGVLFRKSL